MNAVTGSEELHLMGKGERFKTLRAAAALTYPHGLGEWLYDTWEAHNTRYFAGALEVGGIVWGLTPPAGVLRRRCNP